MLNAEPGCEHDEPVGAERRDVAQVLLTHDLVHDKHEQREEEVIGELKSEEGREVDAHVELGITENDLYEHSSR